MFFSQLETFYVTFDNQIYGKFIQCARIGQQTRYLPLTEAFYEHENS